MYNLIIQQEFLDISDLDITMRAEFSGRISGLSYSGLALRVHFFEPFTQPDEVAAQAIIDAHDPVFIVAERDPVDPDMITVTLSKPRNVDNATELTLLIDDVAAPEATALTNNAATVLIQSVDEITIGIVESYPHEEVTI